MADPSASNEKHVVVLGGSYGGVACVNKLLRNLSKDSNVKITLIEKCDARYHCVASYRALVQKDFAKNLWIPYTNLFPKGSPHRIHRGLVRNIYNDHVLVAPVHDDPGESSTSSSELQRIYFDYLVIATGSAIPSPAKWTVNSSTDGLRKLDDTRNLIAQSERIVVIGGGACGVELSGEIKYTFPDKSVTLIHDMPALVDYPRFPESFKEEARRYLTKQGVEVILNQRVEIEGLSRENSVQKAERAVKLKGSDRVINSDLQFFSIGIKVDTSFISTLEPPPDKVTPDKKATTPFDATETLLDPKSHVIKVRPTLQLDHDAFPNIFAIGDISNADPVPTCMAAVAAGETAARNVIKLIRKEEKEAAGHHQRQHHLLHHPQHDHQHLGDEAESGDRSDDETNGYNCHSWNKLETYMPVQTMMVLAMNPTGGVSHLPVVGTWFGNLAARVAKSSDLFSGRFWREMNMPRP
ncbi:Apoptosis-inducing factor 2 [Mortierella sp. 14UC]|nr:Apoptosis-inducing factor 2 [Mortierella sp. 14UC]